MDKNKVTEKLNEFFGDKTVRVFMPKQFLANLSDLLTKQNKVLVDQVKANNVSPELIEETKKTQDLLIELKKAIQENKVDKVEVSNLKEYPKPEKFPEIKIPEQKEIKIPEFPKEINLKEPVWYEKIQNKLIGFIADVVGVLKKSFASDLDRHKEAGNAFAVRLVTYDGKDFYNAMFSGGGGGVPNPLDVNMRGYNDTNWQPVGLDTTTRALSIIQYEHHEIHEGNHFFYADGITLAAAAKQQYMITTPNTLVFPHLLFSITGGLGITITIDEAGDRVGTTLQTVYNSDRNSLNAATTIIHKGTGGGSTDGTEIATFAIGSASVGGKIGGGIRASEEIILKRNTKYIFEIASVANANNIAVYFTWYERLDFAA